MKYIAATLAIAAILAIAAAEDCHLAFFSAAACDGDHLTMAPDANRCYKASAGGYEAGVKLLPGAGDDRPSLMLYENSDCTGEESEDTGLTWDGVCYDTAMNIDGEDYQSGAAGCI